MYVVYHRYAGDLVWSRLAAPQSVQAAFGHARDLKGDKRFADEVQIQPASADVRLLELKV